MRLIDFRKELKNKFSQHNIEVKDVDYIISEVINLPITQLNLVDELDENYEKEILKCCEERLNHKPVQKIFGKAYFYGLEFMIDEKVLCPRPETEMLVDVALDFITKNRCKKILDLCTGSGCVAISIKKNADVEVTATDISEDALKIAKCNALKNEVKIDFIKSDMFENIGNKFDVIVSNPPYIASSEVNKLDLEVKNYDPKLALDGGETGLNYYIIIHDNLKKHLKAGGIAIMEIGEDQKEKLLNLFKDYKYVNVMKDYSNNNRILIVKN